jgi:hypothetical protein
MPHSTAYGFRTRARGFANTCRIARPEEVAGYPIYQVWTCHEAALTRAR